MSNTMWGGHQHDARPARPRWHNRPWGFWITASIARYALTVAIFATICAGTGHLQVLLREPAWHYGAVALTVALITGLQARRRS
jgi:hypothetical protein